MMRSGLIIALVTLACALGTPAVAQAATTVPHRQAAITAPMPATMISRTGTASTLRPYDDWWACYPGNGGSQCDQTDPYDTGCASSKIYVASGDAKLNGSTWQVQLYYSTGCGTVWSRLQLLSGPNSCFDCLLEVTRLNYNASNYATSGVGSDGGTIYSGAWSNQLYLPCGGVLTAYADLWHFIDATLGYSNKWYPGC